MRISDWSSDVCSSDLAKGFLQSAQTVAIRMSHQRIGPEHLLKALPEDQQGMASGLIKAAGGDAGVALRETDAALAKVPAVSGSGAEQTQGLDHDAVRVLDSDEQVADTAGDSSVPVERLKSDERGVVTECMNTVRPR